MSKQDREAAMRIPWRDIIANGRDGQPAKKNGVGPVTNTATGHQPKSTGARPDAAGTKPPLAVQSVPVQYRDRSRAANASVGTPDAEAAPIPPFAPIAPVPPAEAGETAVVGEAEAVGKVEGIGSRVKREAEEANKPSSPSVPDKPAEAVPYKVGKGCPPKHTQFKPGESGNKKGRPKGRKNNATAAGEVLDGKVPVRINGKMRRISLREVALQQLGKRAEAGDAKAFKFLLDMEGPAAALEIAAKAAHAPESGEVDPTALAILAYQQRETLRAEGMTDTQIDAVLRSLGLLPPETEQ